MTPPELDEAAEWHRIAEERRLQLERVQSQALFRFAAAMLGRLRQMSRSAMRILDPVRDVGVVLGRSIAALPQRAQVPRRLGRLRSELAALPAPEGDPVGRSSVTAVIVTATQPTRLDLLLTALGRLRIETLVVDNAGAAENAEVITRHGGARRIRLGSPVNYSTANNLAIGEIETDWILLLNDDVLPMDDLWLARMFSAVDARTVAVGAQLVHGPRGLLGGQAVDGTVQHAGIGFVLDGPVARPFHLGRGAAPEAVDAVIEVDAATAACLLVRTDALRAVGGFHPGFDYGSEDVDLCLRLRSRGSVRVAKGAVLLHEEGASRLSTRGSAERHQRRARQMANRALLDSRHASALRRDVVDAAIRGVEGAHGSRVVIGVAGVAPELLRRSIAGHRGLDLVKPRRSGTVAAVTVVTDPDRLPPGGGRGSDVPVVGWFAYEEGGAPVARWSASQLARLDAVIVERGAEVPAEVRTSIVYRVAELEDVRDALRDVLLAPRWSVRIASPAGRRAELWGDTPIANALADELRALGRFVRVAGRDDWDGTADRAADVTLHLKGRGVTSVADAQVNVVWVMSHPSEVAPGELDAADLVLAGSELLAERYRAVTATPVEVLPQAADARRFAPGPVAEGLRSRLLFVGNTRSAPRPAVLGSLDAGLPLTLVGSGWERYVDPRLVQQEHVPYGELAAWYRSAEVVLNDHWDDMARWGLVSNRVFDALACGACVVSDVVPGMSELLDDAVPTFRDRSDVGPVVLSLLDDPDERSRRVSRGHRVVMAAHTWRHRAADLLRFVDELVVSGADSGESA